jgi:two-component system chemotaxis response regulator CheY
MRILLVDDSHSVQLFLKSLLTPYGRCEIAENGQQAVEMFANALKEKSPYDLVVMDIMMPVMDGHTATLRINELQESAGTEDRASIIMLSCLDDTKNLMKAQFDSGAHAYITKPFEKTAILEAMTNLGLLENPLDDPDHDA